MINSGTVWQIPVMPPPKHTVLAATTTASATTTLASTTMQDVERIHEVLCCAGATTMLLYYKHYHGTGFGKASTAAVRNSRCPIKALMQGDANPKRRRTQDAQTESTPPPPPADTTDIHAHAAHSDAEDNVCACCADQPSKCVQFTATELCPTLRGSASEPPALDRRKGLAQGERTTGASAQPSAPGEQAQGEQAQGEQAQGEQAPKRQHGPQCPLATAPRTARRQASSKELWRRAMNGTLTGRSWGKDAWLERRGLCACGAGYRVQPRCCDQY